MMKIRVRVKKVDMDGFCGRDYHPLKVDEGKEGLVTSVDLVPGEPFHAESTTPLDHPMQTAYQVFVVVLDDGKTVELLGHEIELLSCVHDGDL